jgi:2-haloacid dehalogenase
MSQSECSLPQAAVVVFDAYGTLFDVHSVRLLADQCFPGQGQALSQLWRQKQLEYTWLRSLGGRYKSFWWVTQDALRYASQALKLPMSQDQENALMQAYLKLQAFPENLAALRSLKAAGKELAILSNGERGMVNAVVAHAGMEGLFSHVLSGDQVGQYKTAPAVYALAEQAFSRPAQEMAFVSSNAWDACAARWAGFQSIWVNRQGQVPEVLDVQACAVINQLSELPGLFL